MTVAEVASEVGVHPNVARHHLDKLAAGGYIEVVRPRGGLGRSGAPGGPTVEALRRRRVRRTLDVPVRSDDLVLALLGRALDRLPREEAEAMAEEVGATYGRAMATG